MAKNKATPLKADNTTQHFYASTPYTWAVRQTRQEAIDAVAGDIGKATIEGAVKRDGGLWCWTCRVPLPQSAPYEILNYKPEGVEITDVLHVAITSPKGKYVLWDEREPKS